MKKITVISGGSSGLGLEIAELLVKSEKNVLILGRNSNKLREAKARLNKSLTDNFAESFTCNIGEENDIKNVGDYLTKNMFVVEYLFNNAGKGLFTKADSSTSDMIEDVFEANLKGMILLTSQF